MNRYLVMIFVLLTACAGANTPCGDVTCGPDAGADHDGSTSSPDAMTGSDAMGTPDGASAIAWDGTYALQLLECTHSDGKPCKSCTQFPMTIDMVGVDAPSPSTGHFVLPNGFSSIVEENMFPGQPQYVSVDGIATDAGSTISFHTLALTQTAPGVFVASTTWISNCDNASQIKFQGTRQ
jgi:hypothetical protein